MCIEEVLNPVSALEIYYEVIFLQYKALTLFFDLVVVHYYFVQKISVSTLFYCNLPSHHEVYCVIWVKALNTGSKRVFRRGWKESFIVCFGNERNDRVGLGEGLKRLARSEERTRTMSVRPDSRGEET